MVPLGAETCEMQQTSIRFACIADFQVFGYAEFIPVLISPLSKSATGGCTFQMLQVLVTNSRFYESQISLSKFQPSNRNWGAYLPPPSPQRITGTESRTKEISYDFTPTPISARGRGPRTFTSMVREQSLKMGSTDAHTLTSRQIPRLKMSLHYQD